ncbi:hypothetical protein [Kitasatospora sp. NPDC088783]|uniref:hypothetical protein n=1 Tax=Kitasatospora sp. NPDC088783 TaxID=3364077 RepID=UPI00381DDF35
MPSETRLYPISDRWSQAFDLYGRNGVLHGRIAHLIELREGWQTMVATGHFAEVYDPDGQVYYVALKTVGRLPRTWATVDGAERRIVPFGHLRRPCGPLDPGRTGASCSLWWCRRPAARLFQGIEVCSPHDEKLTSPSGRTR